jgi:hypothetical protein
LESPRFGDSLRANRELSSTPNPIGPPNISVRLRIVYCLLLHVQSGLDNFCEFNRMFYTFYFQFHTDNFDWGNDDSVFCQIPDVFPEPDEIPEPVNDIRNRSLSLSPVRTSKPANSKTKTTKANAAGSKIKLPKKLGASRDIGNSEFKERASASYSLSQPARLSPPILSVTPPNSTLSQDTNSTDHTPMLNYSSIDTPILKVRPLHTNLVSIFVFCEQKLE